MVSNKKPLPNQCSNTTFETISERQQARAQYQKALQDGHRTALLEQERSDVFSMQVGNIPPGETVKVVLTYCERLPFFDRGYTELRLPLVVAERCIPGNALNRPSTGKGTHPDTDQVPDASRITPPILSAGFDPNVALRLSVDLLASAGELPEDLSCSQHATRVRSDRKKITVGLSKENERLNRDFVLQWRLVSSEIKPALLTYSQGGDKYAMLTILPPKRKGYLGAARDILFVLDRSGSMQGIKMVSARRACSILLNSLSPRDRFAICAFDDVVEWMATDGGKYIDADESGIEQGEQFLQTVDARGGTEMFGALQQALSTAGATKGGSARIPIVVLLTDGQIGNESAVLKHVQQQIGATRLFSIGIDTAVNSGLLAQLANLGGGTSAFVSPGAALESALRAISREIGNPLVTDISVTVGNHSQQNSQFVLAPHNVPDLFSGRAVTALIKLDPSTKSVRVDGKFADGKPFTVTVGESPVELGAIAQLWAKARVSDLEDRFRVSRREQDRLDIIRLAVQHQILTRLTAFVAVDESEVVNADLTLRTIVQPVEQAELWQLHQEPMAPQCAPPGAAPGQMFSQLALGPAGASSVNHASLQRMRSCESSSDDAAMSVESMQDAFLAEDASWGSPAPSSPPPPPLGASSAAASGNAPSAKRKDARSIGSFPLDSLYGFFKKDGGKKEQSAIDQWLRDGDSIRTLFVEFIEMLRTIRNDLSAGTNRGSEAVDKLYKKLLTLSNTAACSTDLPALQRFLRGPAVELIDSLNQDDVPATDLVPMWDAHLEQLTEILADLTNQLEGRRRGEPNFWESSI